MNEFVPLLADAEDLIALVVVAIFMVLGAAGQLVNKAKAAKQKEQQRRPPQRPAPQHGPQRAGGGQPVAQARQGPLQDEISDFLRGAVRRRGVVRAEAAGQGGQQPIEAEIVEAADENVAAHVQDRFGGERFGRLSGELGQEVAQADDQMAERVHEVFDHKLGQLSGTPGGAAAGPKTKKTPAPEDRGDSVPATAAAGLAAMLADPGNIRQAIVLSEIIQRPESRWS